MGRGRAKAKQTKVARELKYRSHETDFSALARELHGENDDGPVVAEAPPPVDDDVEDVDEWSEYASDRDRD